MINMRHALLCGCYKNYNLIKRGLQFEGLLHYFKLMTITSVDHTCAHTHTLILSLNIFTDDLSATRTDALFTMHHSEKF